MKYAPLTLAAVVVALSAYALYASEQSDRDVLNSLSMTTNDDLRAGLIQELRDSSGDNVRIKLEKIAANENEADMIRMEAVCALNGSATGDSVPVLLDTLEQDLAERKGLWACAIPLLGELKDRRAVQLLLRVAGFEEENLAGMDHMAISALSQMATEAEVSFLEGKAHILPVRLDVMRALSRIASPTSADVLVSGLQDEEEPELVRAATAGLKRIGVPALPTLESALENQPDEVLKTRVRALIGEIE